MKSYVKPVVLENDEIFEGVYAASGALDSGEPSVPEGENTPADDDSGVCWTVTVVPEDANLHGNVRNFRVKGIHPDTVTHISTMSTVVVTFNSPIEEAYWEHQWDENTGSISVSGSTVTITRIYHANAYYSGDNYNSLLQVRAETEELTLALAVVDATISCTKMPNVQGGMD